MNKKQNKINLTNLDIIKMSKIGNINNCSKAFMKNVKKSNQSGVIRMLTLKQVDDICRSNPNEQKKRFQQINKTINILNKF